MKKNLRDPLVSLKNLISIGSFLLIVPTNAFAVDTVTSSTVSSTVSSSSNTVGTTTVDRTPSTASSPSISVINSDICTTGVSGAVQTQIFGISGGTTIRDVNCENLKLSRQLYAMGMKVAAVALLCEADYRVFQAMWDAGTYCPIDGLIGKKAKTQWLANLDRVPEGALVNEKQKVAMLYEEGLKKDREARREKAKQQWPHYAR